ncbi:uncharacterized protein LOC127789592 [Diospyros lotus]|uniref:uncharacterized protein LOC127789592 n=1 Tax=Diospyros lotus TaxID=55363 RepID=UPI002255929F|nr:uncharacterized protein LOC127789592 [Diospyros lotus]
MADDDDWVKAAMTEDSLVADLLMSLRHAPLRPPHKSSHSHPPLPPPALPLDWTVRQRRSRTTLHASKKPAPRSSPTTPLSWSGATSASGGAADGFEESSRPAPSPVDAARSKVAATSETLAIKRSRKKKTLAELKEQEILLLKERTHLKMELATLAVNLEKQRAANESLKRLKLDLESQPAAERVPIIGSPIPSILHLDVRTDGQDSMQQLPTPDGSYEMQQQNVNRENNFALPDLNLPVDEGDKSEVGLTES